MLGNTLVINDGSARTLVKINQDNYASEYLLRTSLAEYLARVRHTQTSAKNGSPAYDRHNFEVVKTTFATDTAAEYYQKFYFVWEHLPSDGDVTLADAVCDLAIASTNAFLVSLSGWES